MSILALPTVNYLNYFPCFQSLNHQDRIQDERSLVQTSEELLCYTGNPSYSQIYYFTGRCQRQHKYITDCLTNICAYIAIRAMLIKYRSGLINVSATYIVLNYVSDIT